MPADTELCSSRLGHRPLDGVKVLDMTRLLPGAFCSQLLADMGADVVKIEEPGTGDHARKIGPRIHGDSGAFLLTNRNKRSLTLNLKTEEGRSAFLRLSAHADVVIEGFRPGTSEKLGVGYETLSGVNPRLVYCAISGYGSNGPYAQRPGHDLNYMAIAGALHLFGTEGSGPVVPGLSIADVGGGSLMAAIGILGALLERQGSGLGQFVDIGMSDGALSWLPLYAAERLFGGHEPVAGLHPFIGQAPCYNIYQCADGLYLALGIIEAHFWRRFCAAVDLPELVDRQWPTGEEARDQRRRLRDLFALETRETWLRKLIRFDLPVTPVNSIGEAFSDPQFLHREMLRHIEHPRDGLIPQIGFPIKLSRTPCAIASPPPMLGEHTEEILREIDYTAEEITELRRSGAI